MSEQVSIGRVKRDISDLVNRVAYRGERIILTSRGKPKAALVSMEDYNKLQSGWPAKTATMLKWMKETRGLVNVILERRGGEPIDVSEILSASRRELDERSNWLTNRD